MAWSQLGYNLYCFKQWYSPLTEACITQFQWLWVKYILIKMCKKWYPTEGLADFQNFPKSITSTAKTSKSKSPHLKISKSESPHFFKVPLLRIINLMKMTKSKFSAFSPYYFHVFSTFSPYFFNSAFSPHWLCGDPQKIVEKMQNSAKDAEIWGTGETCIVEFLQEAGFFYLIWMTRLAT